MLGWPKRSPTWTDTWVARRGHGGVQHVSGQGLLAVGFDHRTSREVVTQGVPVVPARRLPSMLRQLPAVLEPERVPAVADQARIRFHAAA